MLGVAGLVATCRLGRVSLALAVLWVIDLIALLVIQAINSLGGPPTSGSSEQ